MVIFKKLFKKCKLNIDLKFLHVKQEEIESNKLPFEC